MKVRTRFAPSPTGLIHPGGMRTALFAWLLARQNKGQFLLRIEDTDKARELEGAENYIYDSLRWLGLDWDEEPVKQSERLALYKKYAQKLIDNGHAYPDPYTQEEVAGFREQAKAENRPFLYRDHRPDKFEEWDGTQPLRFRIPGLKEYKWKDAVRGDLGAGPEMLDDFIIIKSDGYPTYNFAHIIDDHEMEITHVLRGEEFISSTPKFLALYEALGFKPPVLATMPLVLGREGGKKLSKRDGSLPMLDYREQGYLPEAMNNFLASLGWNDGTEQEIFSMHELVEKFSLERIQKSPARFDVDRLIWINGHHIRNLSVDELHERAVGFWPEQAKDAEESHKKNVLRLVQERLKTLNELPELTSFFFESPPQMQVQSIIAATPEVKELLNNVHDELQKSDFSEGDLESRLDSLAKRLDLKRGDLFKTIRVAVSGSLVSPGLFEMLNVLGKNEVLDRIKQNSL